MRSGLSRALAPRNAGGPPVPAGGSDASGLVPGGPGASTDLTLIRSYKSNGTVYANVSLLASAAAAQQWALYRPAPASARYSTSDRGSDQRKQVTAHAALSLLNSPASITVNGVRVPVWTRFGLFEISNLWMELTGKSHWVVDYGGGTSGIPLGLWPVRPDRMMPVPDREKYLAGWVYTSPDGREKIPLLPTEVIFNRYTDPEDPYGGAGPIRSVLTDIEAADYASQWNRNWFVNSAEPGGVIQVDHELDDEEFDQLVDRWRDTHRGVARAHRIAVLEAGQVWVPNAHSLKDMDFANLRGVMRDTIREAVGMHKVMTGVTDDVNRANAQTGEEVFASWKVSPRLDRWRDVLNCQLLPLFGAAGANVEFDYIYALPANREADALELTAKANAALALVTAGYEQHAVAAAVGLPDMEVALALSSQPALPPRWTAPAPGAGPAAPAARLAAGWDSPAWDRAAALDDDLRRHLAAWNAMGAAA